MMSKSKSVQQTRMERVAKHTMLVTGKGYCPLFGAGAGHCNFEINGWTSASTDWVLHKEWDVLKIRPLQDYKKVKARLSWSVDMKELLS